MEFPLKIIDAFTLNGKPFTGGAAGVLILNCDDDICDEDKQKIASELNLPATAFVANTWNKFSKQEENTFTVRWFTPGAELQLCGHATLAATKALSINSVNFKTKLSGTIRAQFTEELITLDFPMNMSEAIEQKNKPWIEDIIRNISSSELTVNDVKDVHICTRLKYLIIRLKDGDNIVPKLTPDFNKLLQIETNDSIIGVIVTQKASDDKYHFYSRAFFPWIGVNEDSACGSAHSVLASYWKTQYMESGIQSQELIGRQFSKRGAIIRCKIIEDKLQLSGLAKTILTGFIKI